MTPKPKKPDYRTWWRKGMDVGLQLISIGYLYENGKTAKYPRIDGLPDNVTLIGIADETDYVEEQLWAIRRGLA